MTPHCKNCVHHHDAKHPPESNKVRFNDWCCKYSRTAKKAVGECILKNGKKEAKHESH